MVAAGLEDWKGDVVETSTAVLFNQPVEIVVGVLDVIRILPIGLRIEYRIKFLFPSEISDENLPVVFRMSKQKRSGLH